MDTKQQTHTPGPWVYEWCNGAYSDGIVTSQSNSIAIVMGGNYGEWRDAPDNGDAEFEANARLIAAAPELLEACKNLVGHADWVALNFRIDYAHLDEARAAIAKAEGG